MANIRTGRKSGFIMRGGVMRRETMWTSTSDFVQVTLASSAAASILTTFTQAFLDAVAPFTVVRTRGLIQFRTDVDPAPSEAPQAVYGHCVVSTQAVAIGITALPTPLTDAFSDLWFVYESLALAYIDAGTAVESFQSDRLFPFDSKAMRKVEDGQNVVSVAENGSVTGAGCIVAAHFRQLIKLH